MIWSQVCVFQILTNWFPLAVSNTFESREKAKAFPVGEGYFKTSSHSPVCKFQIRTVPPVELEARILESCEKATDWISPECPANTCSHLPVFVERIRIVLSAYIDAIVFESALWPITKEHGPHSSSTTGQARSQLGTRLAKRRLTILFVGENTIADE
ncbi:hypothetical protein RAB80_014790 [Fusarium oxysporum f. sp. vasinfectum]|nr:hypothetical protein RAB80_014790 [Fusarium oxysporum f. sp. vasinfectum]